MARYKPHGSCRWCSGALREGQFDFCSLAHVAAHRQARRSQRSQTKQEAWLAAGTKLCIPCQQEKPYPGEYYLKRGDGRNRDHYDSMCKSCRGNRTRTHQQRPENIARFAEYKRRSYAHIGQFAVRDKAYKKFNATVAAYDLQFQAQHACCAICLRKVAEGEDRFAFDHDHATGLARGVLCSACNGALGSLRDRRDLLLAAIRYLEYWEAQHRLAETANAV